MIHPRKLLEASFRAKVLVPVVACIIGAMFSVFLIVDYRVSEQSEMEARTTLTTANAVIGYSQELQRKNLLLRFHNLPNEPLWRHVFLLGVGSALHDTLRQLMEMQNIRTVCHDLRHTHATLLLQAGVPVAAVSARLGHANAAITLGIYSHSTTDAEAAAAQVAGSLLSNVLKGM